MRSVAILGPGGVGGFLAGALERADATSVTLVAREEAAATIARDGLRVHSVRVGDFSARPRAVAALDGPVDALLVATKAVGLEDALERVRGLEPGIVLPLLNGLGHLDVLRERYGSRAVAGSIRIESTRTRTGEIEQTSPFLRIDMASADPAMHAPLAELAALLERADVPARVLDSEAQAMWGKLVRLNAIALASSAWDLPLGEIRSDPERRAALEACVHEAAAVARAEGATVDPAFTIAELDDAHPELRTSMQRDIAAGRAPELDAIAGSVLRAAARHGLECPTIGRLASLVAQRAGRSPWPRLGETATGLNGPPGPSSSPVG
ncbi:MAG: 2-dehydropantoate 2-reductase [Thermoleophilaceae bacterium]|nr:2-dehydropantoate 2-reductase [Thermoleophilaceae bacterium]